MILDDAAALTPSGFAASAAARLQETEAGVARAARDLGAALISALLHRAEDADAFAGLFADLADARATTPPAEPLSLLDDGAPADAAGEAFVGLLFGDKRAAVTSAIARSAGVRPPTAAMLLRAVAPLARAGLARKIADAKLDAAGFKKLLGAEADAIRRSLPYEASSALKLSKAMDIVREKPATLRVAPKKRAPFGLIAAVVAALLVAVLGFLALSRPKAPAPQPSLVDEALQETAPAAQGDAPADAPADAPTAPYGADDTAQTIDRAAPPQR
jgi:hypothetical protein